MLTDAEKAAIMKKFQITKSRLNTFLRADSRPHIYSNKKFTAVTLAAPYKHDKSKLISRTPITLIFKGPRNVLVLHNNKIDAVERIIKDAKDDSKPFYKPVDFILELLKEMNTDYYRYLEEIEDKIDSLEKSVFRRHHKKQMLAIFKIKKSLMFLHKALGGNREIITMIEKGNVPQIPKKELIKFRYIYNDIIHLIDLQDTNQFIISDVMEMYLSQVSNNLNVIMKKLTAWASLVLIPTLIASIYGMNFKGQPLNMPELTWEYGYFFSLGLMIASVLVLYWYFKKKDWF